MADSSPLISMGSLHPPNSSNSEQSGRALSFNSSIFDGLKPWGDFHPQQEHTHLRSSVTPAIPVFADNGDFDDLDDLPGWDTVVGCGYDVLRGFYADERSCRPMLFDLTSKGMSKITLYGDRHFKKPRNLLVRPLYQMDTTIFTGNSLEEYSSSIATKAKIEGSYSFFSASIEADIGKSEARSTDYSFTKVQSNISSYLLQLPADHKEMLFPGVKKVIDTSMDLDYVFDTYGTHYLASVVMGAHASYNASTRKSQYSSKLDIAVAAKASFEMAVKAEVSLSAEYKEAAKSFSDASKTTIKTSGGNPALGENLASNLAEWTNSVKDYVKLADFVPDQTIGIWKLASTLERQHQLEKHYLNYCERKQTKYKSDVLPLTVRVVPVTQVIQFRFNELFCASRPDNSSDSWSYFGQAVGDSGKTIVVKETEAGSGMLGEIAHWELVANMDTYRGELHDWSSYWRGIPAQPFDYVVLSDLVRAGTDPPTADETKSIKAVHRSCVVASDVHRWEISPPEETQSREESVEYLTRVHRSRAVDKAPTSLDGILDYIVFKSNIERQAYHLRGDCLHVMSE